MLIDEPQRCDATAERHTCVRPEHSSATPHECFCGFRWPIEGLE